MKVCGEAFLLINAWNNFLCLLITARLGNQRFQPGKASLCAVLGAVYALLAWTARWTLLRGVSVLIFFAAGMVFLSFGRLDRKLPALMLGSGWLLAGLSDFAVRRGARMLGVIALCSAAALGLCALLRREKLHMLEECQVEITLNGRSATLRGLPDSGNLLVAGVSGMPVIVASQRQLKPILPPGVRLSDLSTLPPGWHLVRAQTAAGARTLMCFQPCSIVFRQGRRVWRAAAEVAVSDFSESRALVPIALFRESKEGEVSCGLMM